MIGGNRHLTVREVGDEVGISIGSCHQILLKNLAGSCHQIFTEKKNFIGFCHPIFTEKTQICRISTKFVPRFLTDDQKENRFEITQKLLANANGNENFFKNIITGDETWV